jgi:hypothetical protein
VGRDTSGADTDTESDSDITASYIDSTATYMANDNDTYGAEALENGYECDSNKMY